MGEDKLKQVKSAVVAVLEESDLSYCMVDDCICAALVIAARNISGGGKIFSETYALLENTEIFHTAEFIAEKIGSLKPCIEKKDFACFLALCMLRPGANYHLTLYLNQNIDLRVLATNFANEVCACFGAPVGNKLLHDIKNELFLLITQPDMLLRIWNEKFVRTMQQEYEELYKIVKKNSGMISAAFGHELTDRQIVYFMLNFVELYELHMREKQKTDVLLVCNSGSMISGWLSNQLQVFFDIRIVAIVSTYEMNIALEKYDPEYIISTIPILPEKTKCVFVNQFLSQNDISELSMLFTLRRANFRQNDTPVDLSDTKDDENGENLSSIVLEQCICLDAEYCSISEAVNAGGRLLREQGFIEDAYIREIEKAVRENGRFMLIGSNIIMPHSMAGHHVRRTGISVVRLKAPIRLEDVDVEVNWIFTLCAVDRKSHLKALTQLAGIIGDAERMKRMENARSAQELHMLLGEN